MNPGERLFIHIYPIREEMSKIDQNLWGTVANYSEGKKPSRIFSPPGIKYPLSPPNGGEKRFFHARTFSPTSYFGDAMKLQNKVAIVTGGGRGLGRSIALLFGKEGAKVVLVASNKEEIDHVATELRVLRKEAIAVPTDVTDEERVNQMVKGPSRFTESEI
jgi:hypothetical protein